MQKWRHLPMQSQTDSVTHAASRHVTAASWRTGRAEACRLYTAAYIYAMLPIQPSLHKNNNQISRGPRYRSQGARPENRKIPEYIHPNLYSNTGKYLNNSANILNLNLYSSHDLNGSSTLRVVTSTVWDVGARVSPCPP